MFPTQALMNAQIVLVLCAEFSFCHQTFERLSADAEGWEVEEGSKHPNPILQCFQDERSEQIAAYAVFYRFIAA